MEEHVRTPKTKRRHNANVKGFVSSWAIMSRVGRRIVSVLTSCLGPSPFTRERRSSLEGRGFNLRRQSTFPKVLEERVETEVRRSTKRLEWQDTRPHTYRTLSPCRVPGLSILWLWLLSGKEGVSVPTTVSLGVGVWATSISHLTSNTTFLTFCTEVWGRVWLHSGFWDVVKR